jgi:UDP-N-acetylmuramoyl-tripeptide--D-alanyl-D-alanine ligase
VIALPVSLLEPLGTLDVLDGAEEITGVNIDSTRITPGDLFVAVGRGVDYLDDAQARGAAVTLVPDDAFDALAQIGRAVRDRSSAEVVGITGSTGKTSTKDILAALCRPQRRTVAAEASYNAELGVPLTLARIESDTELVITELAMRGFGQIRDLCEMAQPTLGVITTIGPVHLEFVGDVAGVAAAKAELLEALPPGATAVVPARVPELESHLRGDLRVIRVGEDARLLPTERGRLRAEILGETVEIPFRLGAAYQAENALTALTAYSASGLPLERAREGAEDIALSHLRGEEIELPGGGVLINDCWNANPASMRAALRELATRNGGRRLAVVGGMAELGADGPRYHREIGDLLGELDHVIAVGELARDYGAGDWVADAAEAADRLAEVVRPGDVVLVKGSRSVGLERVAQKLTR